MGRQIREYKSLGTTAVSLSTDGKHPEKVLCVMAHWGVAPTTAENFKITYDSSGTYYDANAVVFDPSTGSNTDALWTPDEEMILSPTQKLTVTYTNSDARTLGVIIKTEEI